MFESNLTTLDLIGHNNVHIFKKDFSPEKMVNLDNATRLSKLNSINALMRDHFMQLIEDMENSTSSGKDTSLECLKGQMQGTNSNYLDYFLVKPQGDMN